MSSYSFSASFRRGLNALDAAMLAYSNISAFRQQMVPGDRVHGIVVDGGLAANGSLLFPSPHNFSFSLADLPCPQSSPTMPPSSSSSAPRKVPPSQPFVLTSTDASSQSRLPLSSRSLLPRLTLPFPSLPFFFISQLFLHRAAALATSTTLHLNALPAHLDQRNNSSMAVAYKEIMADCFDQDIVIVSSSDGGAGGGSFSTDFGNSSSSPFFPLFSTLPPSPRSRSLT